MVTTSPKSSGRESAPLTLFREDDLSPPTTILAVIVLYNKDPRNALALGSVLNSAALVPASRLQMKVLLYDNSSGVNVSGDLPMNVEYRHAPNNQGLAGAYNAALDMASDQGFEWLLTLDQDTSIPDNFLDRISRIAQSLQSNTRVAAIVPEVSDHGVFISPNIVKHGRSRRLPKDLCGIPNGELAAINSATTWRVQPWRVLGGFNPLFWLDYLDLWACHVIQVAGYQFYVAGGLHVDHQLSLLDANNPMPLTRFENYLGARCAFCDLHGSRRGGILLTSQFIYKFLAQTIKGDNVKFRSITWKYIKRRIRWTRERRIEVWKKEVTDRLAFPVQV
jgi:glycosyltransferase involved in cell wall biosynthesis